MWQVKFQTIFIQRSQLLVENWCLYVHILDDVCNVSDSERIEIDTYKHPEEGNVIFTFGGNTEITITYCCNCLKGPIDRIQVLVTCSFIHNITSTNPCIPNTIFKCCCHIPEACHQVDEDKLYDKHIEYSNSCNMHIQGLGEFLEKWGLSKNSQHLKHSHQSYKSIKSWQTSQPYQFCLICWSFSFECFFNILSRENSHKINTKPPRHII